MLNYLYFIYFLSWFILGFGLLTKNKLFTPMGSLFLIIAGFITINNGIQGTMDSFTEIFGIAHILMGIGIIMNDALKDL